MRNQHFYKTDQQFLDMSKNCIETAIKAGRLTENEGNIITQYLLEKDAENITATRHWKLCDNIVLNRMYLSKPYDKCNTTDILNGFMTIKNARRNPRAQEQAKINAGILSLDDLPKLKQNTVNDKQRILKAFCLWMIEKKINPTLNEQTIKKLRPVPPEHTTVNKNDLLTPEELNRFFAACKTTRDRALFHLMYEGGLRCSDIGNLRFKDIVITENVCRIKTDGKTGKMRIIPVPESKYYLEQYLNEHPNRFNHTDEDFVFLNRNTNRKRLENNEKQTISRAAINSRMQDIAKWAGITKHIHPHLFRHGRITELTESGMKESHIKQLAWGNQNTGMMRTYSHLNEDDLERELARVNGITLPGDGEQQKQRHERKPVQCPYCGEILPNGTLYCPKCYQPLGKESEDKLKESIAILYHVLQTNPDAISQWALSGLKK